MAALLTQTQSAPTDRMHWWPVDYVILGYFAVVTTIELVYRMPLLAAAHLAAAAIIWLAVRHRASRISHVFRHWYPLPYVAACYKEMAILIPVVHPWSADALLEHLDTVIWRTNPTIWLERWQNPVAVEALQIAYSAFVPAVLLAAAIFWQQRRLAEFRRYAFLIALGFLASYIGYLLVPARGPRFLLAAAHAPELRGLWLSGNLRTLLDRLESAHYDCFPSGHVELTMLAWWGSRSVSRNLSRRMAVYLIGVILATVYLRYHYTVDVIGGAVLAWVIIVASPRLYTLLSRKDA
jgi:membrane-associated phospholipid phosphatase